MPHKVYLVDGSGYIFRAFFAVSPLTTRNGFPTNALFGFFRMLVKLLNASDSQHVVMVFDTGEKNFRHALYDKYKANRPECPPELAKQMPYFRDISRALGMLVLEQPGYEADDILATLAHRLRAADMETVIITGDKDLMQLVGDKISIWDAMKDQKIERAQVREKFGVDPEKVGEVLALIGDTSDNIPGLKGVGPKTAAQLIDLFGDIENLIASAHKIEENAAIRNRKKIVEQIEADKEQIRLSRKLVALDDRAPVEIPQMAECKNGTVKLPIAKLSDQELFQAFLRREPDAQHLRELVDRFEFGSLMKGLNLSGPASAPKPSTYNYKTVWREDFGAFLNELKKQKSFAFDLETTSLNFLEAEIVGISFCWNDEIAYYIPIGHVGEGKERQLELKSLFAGIAPIMTDASIGKIGQNLKFDTTILGQHGIEVEGVAFDTMLASYLINSARRSHNLSVLALDYLGRTLIEYEEIVGGQPHFGYVPIDRATEYGGQDAHCAWLIRKKLYPQLEQDELLPIFNDIEVPLLCVLSRLERKGIKVNKELLANLSDQAAQRLATLEVEIHELAGCSFNINSPKQLSEVLFDKLLIPTKGLKKTKSGISTDSSVLEQIAPHHPIAEKLLEYRSIHKLKSTYHDALVEQIAPQTGRVHSRFNQAVTGTGRLSSSDPNLQNIPIRTAEGRRIREAFIAEAGRLLIVADYSQIELRLLAHLSGDPALIEAFRSGEDIHTKTTREILGAIGTERVTPEQRRIGKTINFGIIYGMGAFRLSRELGIPMKVAQAYIDGYFARYAKVRGYFERVQQEAQSKGFVTTIFGRRRNISEMDTSGRDRDFAMRAAMNAPIQGSAADLIKLAMVKIDRILRSERLPMELVLQVHDELVFECDEGFREDGVKIIKREMEGAIKLEVPLVVDVGWGLNWQAAHG